MPVPNSFLSIYILSFFVFLSCKNKPTNKNEISKDFSETYELEKSWPHFPVGFILSQPTGIGIDTSENIFVFHRTGRRWTSPFPDSLISMPTILELENKTGKILNSWGANLFLMPHGLTVDQRNNIWVTDVGLHQVFKFSHDGRLLMELGQPKTPGNDSVHFNLPTDVAVAGDGSFYVSDGYGNSRVIKFSSTGKYLFEWGVKGNKPGEFDIPHAISIDQKGNVFVADRENNRIQEFDATGRFIKEWMNNEPVQQIPSVTIDKTTQRLFAVDYDFSTEPDSIQKGSSIFKYDSAGNLVYKFGRTGSTKLPVCWYHDIAVDKYGNIYVGDILGKKIQKFYRKIQ